MLHAILLSFPTVFVVHMISRTLSIILEFQLNMILEPYTGITPVEMIINVCKRIQNVNHVTKYVPRPNRTSSYLPKLILGFIMWRARTYDIAYMVIPMAIPSTLNRKKVHSTAEKIAKPNRIQYISD